MFGQTKLKEDKIEHQGLTNRIQGSSKRVPSSRLVLHILCPWDGKRYMYFRYVIVLEIMFVSQLNSAVIVYMLIAHFAKLVEYLSCSIHEEIKGLLCVLYN